MSAKCFLIPDSSAGLERRPITVTAGGIDIGRQVPDGLVLPLDSVSRLHARLSWVSGQWVLLDMGSSNGTMVNGVRTQRAVLKDGDEIVLGRAKLVFRLQLDESQIQRRTGGFTTTTGDLRIVGDGDNDSSVILTAQSPDKTPFRAGLDAVHESDSASVYQTRLGALYRFNEILRDATDRDAILQSLLDLVFDNLPVSRAAVLSYDSVTDEMEGRIFRYGEGGASAGGDFILSRSITRRVIEDRVAVLIRDLRTDSRFGGSESIVASDILSAMCVPLVGKSELFGILFVDSREAVHAFSEDDLAFVSALATDAAMMIENLELLEENIQQERLAAVGQTIAGLAHNIKNILQLARGGLELMESAVARKNFEDIETLWPITRRSIDRMQALTQEMLDFSRQSKPELGVGSIVEVVRHLEEMLRADERARNRSFVVEYHDDCGLCLLNADILLKALMNLVSNAFDALAGRDNEAKIEIVCASGRGVVRVIVRDNGPGIPEDVLARIFEPFFSTKGSKGNGLGLSMTRKYVEDMGGRLEVVSQVGQGAEFTITFPVVDNVTLDR